MKSSLSNPFRENRAKFPGEQLRKFDGQWVAFSADGERIIAAAPTLLELSHELREAGQDLRNVMLEQIHNDGAVISLGAAEL